MKKNSYTPENWGKETVSAIKDITNAVTDGNTIPGQDILFEPKDPKKLTPEEIPDLVVSAIFETVSDFLQIFKNF